MKVVATVLITCVAIASNTLLLALSQVDLQKAYGEELTSRFIITSDDSADTVAGIPLRKSWWSRPHEYRWAAKFANSEEIVLDAACGISHPFKWHLGETCKETWACDADPRIDDINKVIGETYDDLGEMACQLLLEKPHLYEQVKLVRESICSLPSDMPLFGRIFCISTLEHLCDKDRKDAFAEFARLLAPDGLLVITVDYPEITPECLIDMADSVGLVPAGDVSMTPSNKDLNNGFYRIYRAVFVHK